MRPRALQQNLHTMELISARKTFNSHMACIALVEFMYLVFTRMPRESYRRRLRSLLFDCVTSFRALINCLFVDWACLLWTGFDLVAFAIDCVMSGTVVQPFGYTIHCSFIAKRQYIGTSLPRVNTIHWSFIANCQYNTLELHCQVSIQYIAARNVLWCQVHSLRIHANHKTSFN